MSNLLKRFKTCQRGTTFEGIALSVSIVAVAFVASADMLDYVVKKHVAAPTVATAKPSGGSGFKDLDETPTASVLPKLVSRSVLDPCTGATK